MLVSGAPLARRGLQRIQLIIPGLPWPLGSCHAL